MRVQALSAIALFSSSAGVVHAFSRPALVSTPVVSAVGPLNVGMALDWKNQDLDESFLMQRAEACAHSDSCSLEDARVYLDDVIHVQSGCVTGSVLGGVCENVDVAAELVANLRQKIVQKTREAM